MKKTILLLIITMSPLLPASAQSNGSFLNLTASGDLSVSGSTTVADIFATGSSTFNLDLAVNGLLEANEAEFSSLDIANTTLNFGYMPEHPEWRYAHLNAVDALGTTYFDFTTERWGALWSFNHWSPVGLITRMRLAYDGTLNLYNFDPYNNWYYNTTPTIKLDPNGDSYFDKTVRMRGKLLVAPQGDLLMGQFTAGTQP